MAADRKPKTLVVEDVAFWGAVLAGVGGLVLAVLGAYLLVSSSGPGPLRVILIGFGGGLAVLAYHATRGSRFAWSFATACCGTLSIIFLFGAPKLRDITEYSLAVSALPFLYFVVASTLLSFRQGD